MSDGSSDSILYAINNITDIHDNLQIAYIEVVCEIEVVFPIEEVVDLYDLNYISHSTLINCDERDYEGFKPVDVKIEALEFNIIELFNSCVSEELGSEIFNLKHSSVEVSIFPSTPKYLAEVFSQEPNSFLDELSLTLIMNSEYMEILSENVLPITTSLKFYSITNNILPYDEEFEYFCPEFNTLLHYQECNGFHIPTVISSKIIYFVTKKDAECLSETDSSFKEQKLITFQKAKKVRIQNRSKSKERKKNKIRTIKLYEHYFPEIISDDEIPSPFRMNLFDFSRKPVKRESTSESLLERLSELEPNTVEDHLIIFPNLHEADSNSILSLTNSVEPSDIQSQVAPPFIFSSENELSSRSSSTPTRTNAEKSSSFSSSVSRSGRENDLKSSVNMSSTSNHERDSSHGLSLSERQETSANDDSQGISQQPGNPQQRSQSTTSALEKCRSFFKKLRSGSENEEKYTCVYCARAFDSGEELEKHLLSHTTPRIQHCYICFKTVANLQRHMKRHLNSKPYPCQFCSKAFNSLIQLNQHSRVHTGHSAYECKYCEKTFSVAAHLYKHYRTHRETLIYKCPQCDKAFSEQDSLENHLRHHVSAPKPLQCNFCPRTFANTELLNRHLLDHEDSKPLRCNFCIKSFSNLLQLNTHTFSHMEESSLPMTTYNRAQSGNLHRAASTSVYSLICAESHRNGEGHIELERPYVCPLCDEGFSKVSHYNRHVRQHSAEKPFACSLCGEMFDKEKDFRKHRNTHIF